MSCSAVNCNTPKGERIFKRHMHHNPKTADICQIFFFTLFLETCHIDIKRPNEKQKGYSCFCPFSQGLSLKTVLNEVQTKVKCKLQLSQQPPLPITHITSLILQKSLKFTLMYTKYTQKGDIFSSFSNAFKSSCTFRAIKRKKGILVY